MIRCGKLTIRAMTAFEVKFLIHLTRGRSHPKEWKPRKDYELYLYGALDPRINYGKLTEQELKEWRRNLWKQQKQEHLEDIEAEKYEKPTKKPRKVTTARFEYDEWEEKGETLWQQQIQAAKDQLNTVPYPQWEPMCYDGTPIVFKNVEVAEP